MAKRTRPPLKWAGGKFRLLDRILPALPAGKRLVEPFAGSGAVFLNADYPAFLLCDLNPDLINFYRVLVEDGEGFIKQAQKLFRPEHNTGEAFYELRSRFNASKLTPARAALFLYLNRHAYNGLVRYNRQSEFNTPFGKYAAPYFPRAELAAVLAKSRRARLEFAALDFRGTFAALEPGDVVYCDPPYLPLSSTANFTAYTADGFGPAEQKELARCAEQAAGRGNPVVLSNHATDLAREIYGQAEIDCFAVRRCISRDGANRAKALELLAVYKPS
ncbi:MAG: Dam family site-specific DNA-(adenine-N6)-methyltransferase [Deltaproteobacteria bacterium]|jgi:DNA adenine methylase|nr:Dam family site-specific DNA-(adenine-N6)-methyltransferase [Deltaproteobacteria bacterium]